MGLLLLLLALAYFDSWMALFALWASQDQSAYSFGFLVLLCTCYLVYLKRGQLADLNIRHAPWLLLPVLLLSCLWVVASFVELQTVQLAVLPLMVLATTTAFFGTNHFRLTALPVLLLLFAVPLWWPLLPILKDITVLVTEGFLRVIGKPLFVGGLLSTSARRNIPG